MSEPNCLIDGFGPLPIVRPPSLSELGKVICDAASAGSALYPIGGRTEIGLGMPPSRSGQAVDMRSLDQVLDFPARDMTITVQAGINIHALREILKAEGLQLPIDVPASQQATLGGVIAANTSGPRRYGYGTMRDYVIGISALNDEGREFKAGGRVVKNVAGYDLCKLLVGSLGTLGIITYATLKLRPTPEQQAVISMTCDSAKLERLLTCLHESHTRPSCLEVMNCAAAELAYRQAGLTAPPAPWLLLAGFEGNADAVSWQVQQFVKEVGAEGNVEARIDFTASPLCHALIDFAAAQDHAVTFKANLLPSRLAAFCLAADDDTPRPSLRAHAGNGIVTGHWSSDLTKEQADSILTSWRARIGNGPGSAIVTRCPSDWKAALSVWGPAGNDAWLMHEIKSRFDPKRIFNPGRFVDGI